MIHYNFYLHSTKSQQGAKGRKEETSHRSRLREGRWVGVRGERRERDTVEDSHGLITKEQFSCFHLVDMGWCRLIDKGTQITQVPFAACVSPRMSKAQHFIRLLRGPCWVYWTPIFPYPEKTRSCPWPGSSCCSPHRPSCRQLPGWPASRRWTAAGFLPPELPGSGRPVTWSPDIQILNKNLLIHSAAPTVGISNRDEGSMRQSFKIILFTGSCWCLPVRALWWSLDRL